MPLWVNIENVASGLFVTMSKAQNGAQLCLEVDDTDDDVDVTQREVSGKEEQLWDYDAATGIFQNKTGFVADMNKRTNKVTMTIKFLLCIFNARCG